MVFLNTFPNHIAQANTRFLVKSGYSDSDLIIPNSNSGKIGDIVYATVKLDGQPIFQVAAAAAIDTENNSNSNSPVEVRAKQIEDKLQGILKQGFDPNTLRVFPSILNNQQIIVVSDQKKLQPRTILTITDLDSQLYGQPANELAETTAEQLHQVLLKAWQERQSDYLNEQYFLGAKISLGMFFSSAILLYFQKYLQVRVQKIKKKLRHLTTAIAEGKEEENFLTQNSKSKIYDFIKSTLGFRQSEQQFLLRLVNQPKLQVSPELDDSEINKLLIEKTWKDQLNKKLKFIVLLRRLLQIGQIIIWLRGLSLILILFPHTRELGFQVAGAPVSLVLIWLCVFLVIKANDFIVDYLLNVWIEDISFSQTVSQRYSLRIPTLTSALKGIVNFFLFLIGMFFSLKLLNIPVEPILAGAGILGFAISFGSQNLIKSMISGAMNVLIDSYAVGDWVVIGDITGLVENMNLFFTQIRSSDGDLITIPNGEILIVQNQSKDWSRVNFRVQISSEIEVDRAMEVVKKVAEEMYNDGEWGKYILDPSELLGVEAWDHTGITIRLLIKTQPAQQWKVAREFRRRLKQTFDREGISIGIPKQSLWVQNSP